MNKRFEEADLSRIRATAIAGRASKVHVGDIVDPRAAPVTVSAAELARAFPRVLAADSFLRTAEALRRARAEKREIVWLMGAHVIKCGLGGYLNALIDDGFVTCLATTRSSGSDLSSHGQARKWRPNCRSRFSISRRRRSDSTPRFASRTARDGRGGDGCLRRAEEAPPSHQRDSGAYAGHPATVHVALVRISPPHPVPAARPPTCRCATFAFSRAGWAL
jgi:hypothetical protein